MLNATATGPHQAGSARLVKAIESDIELLEQLWKRGHRDLRTTPRDLVDSWIRRLQAAIEEAASCQLNTPEFHVKIEESLMLAAGLNVPLRDGNGGLGRLSAQWSKIRDELNTLLLLSTARSSDRH